MPSLEQEAPRYFYRLYLDFFDVDPPGIWGEYSVLLITDDRSRYRWVIFTAKGYTVIPA